MDIYHSPLPVRQCHPKLEGKLISFTNSMSFESLVSSFFYPLFQRECLIEILLFVEGGGILMSVSLVAMSRLSPLVQ